MRGEEMTDIVKILADELGIKTAQVDATIKLIDEGNTIPFISRYRKEATGSLNDEILRQFDERLRYLRNLEEKKEQVISAIEEQGKLTEELRKEIEDIQKSDDEIKKEQEDKTTEVGIVIQSTFNIFGSKDISSEIYQGNNDEDEVKNIYHICDKNYVKLANEIIYVNVKREELWKSIRDIQEYLSNLGILTENKTDYSEFTLENVEIPKLNKEISFLNNK